jgi:hypothetical protein
MIFVHPGSRVQKQQKERGVKVISCPSFFCSHKNHKIKNYINFEAVKKKIRANLQRIIELSTQKLSLSSQGLESGIRKKPIRYPGSKGQKGTGFDWHMLTSHSNNLSLSNWVKLC